ncbi:MAG: sigma 54-interacting transcriptional regulator [Fimbriimonadales bacterium]
MTKESAPEELVKAIRKILAGGQYVSPTLAEKPQGASWLVENGPRELELLFRAIIYHPAAPLLIADNDGHYRDASSGAEKLLGLSREKIIGRSLDDFVDPSFKPQISELWQAFLKRGEQEGSLRLVGPDGSLREVEYTAKGNVLPERHLLVLRDLTVPAQMRRQAEAARDDIPAWVQDFALFLLNVDGNVVAWYSGAERIYGYNGAEAIGQHGALLYPSEDTLRVRLREELKRCAAEGHFVTEDWCVRKDGARFWANVITIALKDENGELQGFAGVVRDFSERRERDEKLRRTRASLRYLPTETTISGIVSGEFNQIPEANDAFLELVGYSREDLLAGRLSWPALTPPEYFALDELAHEEGLRFGACTPFEKELTRKDGTRVPVLVTTAVLKLSPFRWITFVRELRERDRQESNEDQVIESKHDEFEEIIGRSAAMKRTLSLVKVVAPTDATVLILGETGTGKELVARAVHRMSPRRDRPFITLNCAAIPTGLLESELFGYERGAFTGALSQKIGRFEMAHRGTLFLDEVGDIPLDLQPKLLRALQEKAFERLGGTKTIPIDVRLVAATNRNLTQMMGDKLFRSDLYYRLKVFPITTLPLRDHPEDIPVLARHFTQKYAREMNKQIEKIPSDTMQALVSWPWPGNVRELENFIERSVILSRGPNLNAPLVEIRPEALEPTGISTLDQVEREHILKVLRAADGGVSKAAVRLGMPRTTLNAMMKKLGISRADL